jgi:hypothetical protein
LGKPPAVRWCSRSDVFPVNIKGQVGVGGNDNFGRDKRFSKGRCEAFAERDSRASSARGRPNPFRGSKGERGSCSWSQVCGRIAR